MPGNRRPAMAMALLGLLAIQPAWGATIPTAIAPVWFGAFTNTLADGKVSHDVTALVLAQDGVKLTGSVGPTMDRLAPIDSGAISGNTLSFHMAAAGGVTFTLRREAGHLVGTAKGPRVNAALDLTPATGLMPHAQLVAEITAADERNFAAYESCDADRYRESLSPDLEFYQDNQPVKNREQIIASLTYRCAEGIQYRRELDQPSLIINAAPPDAAIEAGLQRIYAKQPDGSERLEATVRFTMVWRKTGGAWQLTRVVSYDHR